MATTYTYSVSVTVDGNDDNNQSDEILEIISTSLAEVAEVGAPVDICCYSVSGTGDWTHDIEQLDE